MSVHAVYIPVDHSVPVGVRRIVAVGVLVLHALAASTLWLSRSVPVGKPEQAVMVSFVDAPQAVVAAPAPPAVVQEASPVLARDKPVAVASATAPVTEPVTVPATPAAEEPVSGAGVVGAPPSDVAVPAAVSAAVIPPSFGAAYLNNPKPVYPLASKRLGEEGVTTLLVLVSAEGRPQQVQVEYSSGSSRLDVAAQKAVRGWRFVPAREGDIAVAGWVTVPIKWKLDN